ncbi:THAP domain-containing protein 6-like [Aphis craccivora]|uniref:THAP domain-containing protein 6-like n=1 Tax=Aphis craccivora TaxID=307492 RepID=A0A6G0Y0J3_APHCR|nr:THAP domain-containing protein 6-like [Aphis craccivora]
MPSNKCCVLGCESGNSVKKNNRKRKIGGSFQVDVRKTYLICTKHFNSSNYSCGTFRLKKGSLPTVSLPCILLCTRIFDTTEDFSIISPKTLLDGPDFVTIGFTYKRFNIRLIHSNF